MSGWHIARARLGKSRWVANALRKPLDQDGLGILTLCPAELREQMERGKITTRLLPIFGPYLFFNAPVLDDEMWHEISDWPYVAEIMGGVRPWPVLDVEIAYWHSLIDTDGIIIDPKTIEVLQGFSYSVGDRVLILQGPFRGQTGTCVWIDDQKIRVGIEIDGLLGLDPVVYLPAVWCEKEQDGASSERRPGGRGRRGHRVRHKAQRRRSTGIN